MLLKKKATTPLDTPETIIGKGILLEAAKISGKESVQIDGCFRGQINIEGSLIISDTGDINGDTHATYVLVAGRVNGNITCESTVHLASTARVMGDVFTKALVVDEGSQITGRYAVGETALEANGKPGVKPGGKSNEKSYLVKAMDIVDKENNN